MNVIETIRKAAAERGEGAPIMAREFLGEAGRAAIDQALTRLCRAKELLRLRRGVYVRPVKSRFGTRAPSAEKVVAELGKARGETITPTGAASANALGLTTQVPVRQIYLTSGPSQRLQLGAQEVELRHAPAWQLLEPQTIVGQVLRAMASFTLQETPEQVARLRQRLLPGEVRQIAALSSAVPSWMAQRLAELRRG